MWIFNGIVWCDFMRWKVSISICPYIPGVRIPDWLSNRHSTFYTEYTIRRRVAKKLLLQFTFRFYVNLVAALSHADGKLSWKRKEQCEMEGGNCSCCQTKDLTHTAPGKSFLNNFIKCNRMFTYLVDAHRRMRVCITVLLLSSFSPLHTTLAYTFDALSELRQSE